MTERKSGTDLINKTLKDSRINGVLLEAAAVRELLDRKELVVLLKRLLKVMEIKWKLDIRGRIIIPYL